MTVEEYLSQLKWIDGEIRAKKLELLELRSMAEGLGAKEMTGMPGGSGSKDRMGDTVGKIVDLERYIDRKIGQLIDMKMMIDRQIDELEDSLQRDVLHRKYVLMQSWSQIADGMGYSKQSCYRFRRLALKEFCKLHKIGNDEST